MSRYPHIYIEVKNNKTGLWDKVSLYMPDDKGEMTEVNFWPWNGTHDLFNVLDLEWTDDIPLFNELQHGLPSDVSPEVESWYNKSCYKIDDLHKYEPTVRWFNLADALLYLRDYPLVKNYDYPYEEDNESTNEGLYKPNPLQELVNKTITWASLWIEQYYADFISSNVRVIAWLT